MNQSYSPESSGWPATYTNTSAGIANAERLPQSFTLSFALPEWARLLLIGALIEFFRRMSSTVSSVVSKACWVTVTFDNEDACYQWVLFWLSKDPSWRNARVVEATTRNYGLHSRGVQVPGQNDKKDTTCTMSYMPSMRSTHTMWFKGYYTVVWREQVASNLYRVKEALHISILTRDNKIMEELLLDAKNCYVKAEEDFISIFASDSDPYSANTWKQIASRPKRPLESIILEQGVKEMLVNDARNFLASADWYATRGIPFRRGYLLHGAPGSGKTSVIQSIAGELGLDVYILTLARAGMDDNTLGRLVAELPKRCIALLEDIDAAFHHGVSRDLPPGISDQLGGNVLALAGAPEKRDDAVQCRVTLSGLLNALDGIGAQEGRILFATTNHYAALDPALSRPGRMDLHVEFKLASKDQAERLFYRFYMPSNDQSASPGTGATPCDCAHDSHPMNAPNADTLTPPPTPTRTDADDDSVVSEGSLVNGGCENAACRLGMLAHRFGEKIPERRFSMARLQGYLMMHKDCPEEAVQMTEAWVRKETAGQG